MSELGNILYSAHVHNVNQFNNNSHSRTFKPMAKINDVIVQVEEQFAIPGEGMIGESIQEQIKSKNRRIAIVQQVLSSSPTRDGNVQHFYLITFPFSETPDKPVLMTNQCWLPINIEGRKIMEPEVLKDVNGPWGVGVSYKDVDFYKEFSKEDMMKGI